MRKKNHNDNSAKASGFVIFLDLWMARFTVMVELNLNKIVCNIRFPSQPFYAMQSHQGWHPTTVKNAGVVVGLKPFLGVASWAPPTFRKCFLFR